MTNFEPAAIVLECWEQILINANAKPPVREAYANARRYFDQHPDALVAHPYGHLGKAQKKLPNFFTRLLRKIFKLPTPEFESDFKAVLLFLSRRSLGRPSLEDRYAVFYTKEQLGKNLRLFSKWGEPWRRALQGYFERNGSKQRDALLRSGIIIGYGIVSHKENVEVKVPLWGMSKRTSVVIENVEAHIVSMDSKLSYYLRGLFLQIKSKLIESETYLIRYKTRNIASALSTSIALSAPFVFLGYVLDLYLLPMLAAVGMAAIFWKSSEILIRYMQGSLDTVIQFYELKKDHRAGGTCRDEENAAKWGVYASVFGPLAALVAPYWLAIMETSRTYAVVAIINATVDNLVSALRKAATNWANAKVLGLAAMNAVKHILKDTYVLGNFIGAVLIFLVDFGGRSLVPPTFFEFLRIVAVEGLVIGMLDSEITAVLSRGMIEYQNHKWQKFLNENTFAEVYKQSMTTHAPNGAVSKEANGHYKQDNHVADASRPTFREETMQTELTA